MGSLNFNHYCLLWRYNNIYVGDRVGYHLNFIDSGSDSAYRFRFLSIPNSESNKIKKKSIFFFLSQTFRCQTYLFCLLPMVLPKNTTEKNTSLEYKFQTLNC